VAALRPEKNHQRFLRIAVQIRQRHVPAAEFIIVGDGPAKTALQKYSRTLNIEHAVHFLGSRGDVEQVLAACDVFMLTSDNEASPVSIMEAMACGLPVIAPAVGSVSEIVAHKETGFVIDKGNERQFARRCGQLLEDRPLAKSMGKAGTLRIQHVGSLARMVAGYERLLTTQFAKKRATRLMSPLARFVKRQLRGTA
jgi:glycosyltransferase involved in cell wall biosynthesis